MINQMLAQRLDEYDAPDTTSTTKQSKPTSARRLK